MDPPPDPWHLSDLIQHIGPAVRFIVSYDPATGRFISFFPDFPDDSPANKIVKGGDGYIVVMAEAATVSFSGIGWWGGIMPAAPPLNQTGTPVLVIDGLLFNDQTRDVFNGAKVVIRNTRTGAIVEDVTGYSSAPGTYTLTFANLAGESVAEVGDTIEISIFDPAGRSMTEPTSYRLTSETLGRKQLTLEPRWVAPIPKTFALLNNYPNPFNPETWIPYQLAERAGVSIEIYDTSGRLVRALELGEQPAGTYLSRAKAAYWDGKNNLGESVTSGVYFYVLKAGSFSDMKKMVILK
jgi:hypothetical protein